MTSEAVFDGTRHVVSLEDEAYPDNLRHIAEPPEKLYVVGSMEALAPGLAVIGARKATPYGRTCASRFARIAAEKGVCIVSGGARGCDSEAHRAALAVGAPTVAILGGGCDRPYPASHRGLFQRIIDNGGAIASEHPWTFNPLPYTFRARNRIIAGLAEAVLIVEAGLPSGTFSTADAALDAGKEVLVVPGCITSGSSHGSNRLLYQGATPIVDDESFEDVLFRIMGVLKFSRAGGCSHEERDNEIIEAVKAEPLGNDELLVIAERLYGKRSALKKMMADLSQAEIEGKIARQPDGKWGPTLPSR